MDIDDLQTVDAHEEGAEVCIKDIDGKDTDFFIKVMGVDSREYQKQLVKIRNNVYRAIAAGNEPNDDEIEESITGLAAVTLSWRGLTRNGKEVKFSKSECESLYRKAPRVRQQVELFIGDAKNFTKG